MERVRILGLGIFGRIRTYLEMIKIEHSVFALPLVYAGLVLAHGGVPPARLIFWIGLAMVAFRSIAMGLNRLIDAKVDALNPRTRARAIPSGQISVGFVHGVNLVFFLLYMFSTFQLGRLCFYLSPIPVILAAIYPLMKRFTWLSHFVLGIILGIAPYGAWLATRGDFSWIPALLMAAISFWVAGFDVLYALQDLDFDRAAGLYSIPSRFGYSAALQISRILHACAVFFWMTLGIRTQSGIVYFFGLAAVAWLLFREHWLIQKFGLSKLEEAFFLMNAGVSFCLFLAIALDRSFRGFFL